MLKRIRVISQILFFVAYAATFFVAVTVAAGYTFPSPWFLWLNPLVALLTTIAGRHVFLPLVLVSAVVALATILFGRFFCGMICPLGALIDFSDKFLYGKRRPKLRFELQKGKYIVLIALAVLAVFGCLITLFLDPISILTRFFTLVVNPLAATVASQSITASAPFLRRVGLEQLTFVTIKTPIFYAIIGVLGLMAAIVGAGFFQRRFWCQNLCPSGAFFALLSRFPIFRRVTNNDKCTGCQACVALCPTQAILENGKKTSTAECILCGACTDRDKGCNRFGFAALSTRETCGADIKRRQLLAGIATGLALLPAVGSNAMAKRDNTGRLIRPPGTVPEKELLGTCISCGSCMKACPTNAIQPCSLSDGFQRIYTPKIVPRIGPCEEKCHLCGYVCPTGVIRKLPYDDKRFVKIGTAVIDRHRCLAWEQNKECLVCDESCPYSAITARFVDTTKGGFKVPVVDEDLCMGCGQCEHNCPIDDEAAIVVYKFGEMRRSSGPYVTPEGKGVILERRKASRDTGRVGPGAAAPYTQPEKPVAPSQGAPNTKPGAGDQALPPGFTN